MPPMRDATTGTPAAISSWADAIFGTATKGAQTYKTVVDTVTGQQKVVPVTGAKKDNTLLYMGIGLAALLLLGGGTYFLTKKKGR